MTHPTDADVEAMARALCRADNESFIVAGDIAKNKVPALIDREWQNWERMARAAKSALPHYLRAVETLERLRSASKHGESRGRSSGSDPVRVAEEASLPDADLIRAVEEREGLIEALKPFLDEADRWAAWALEFKVTDYELSHCTGKVKVSALLNLRAALSRALALQSRAREGR